MEELGRASRIRRATCLGQDAKGNLARAVVGPLTGMTSRPMPSPGIRPIRNDLGGIGDSSSLCTRKDSQENFGREPNAKTLL